eukprot:5089826-Prymnesium_polylepis.1
MSPGAVSGRYARPAVPLARHVVGVGLNVREPAPKRFSSGVSTQDPLLTQHATNDSRLHAPQTSLVRRSARAAPPSDADPDVTPSALL